MSLLETAEAPKAMSRMQKWWMSYEKAKQHFEQKQNWDLSKDSKLSAWATATRKSWNEEKLDECRMRALQEISFPRRVPPGAKRPQTRPDVEHLLHLREKISEKTANEAERAEAEREEVRFAKLYTGGQLSRRYAIALGLE
jgi:hypothetical protein